MNVLAPLYGTVLIPPAVRDELLVATSQIGPFPLEQFGFLRVHQPARVLTFADCDLGESEALSLALELGVKEVLIDEADARREATRLGLRPSGVLAVLVRAKAGGLIPDVGTLIDALQSRIRFRVAAGVRTEALRQAGEL